MARRIEIFSAGCPDRRLLGCCSNAGPDRDELVAAGVGQSRE